jgi:hypothetical protein
VIHVAPAAHETREALFLLYILFSSMVNPVVTSYVISDFIFLATGVMLITASIVWQKELASTPTTESVARTLLLEEHAPLMGMILEPSQINFHAYLS